MADQITPTPVIQTQAQQQFPLMIRVLWFVLVGWWLSAVVIVIGYLLCSLIITMPLGIYVLHRVPQAQTLRVRSTDVVLRDVQGRVVWQEQRALQYPFLIRAVWFIFVGLWLSSIWLSVAWALSITIVGIPLSVMMIDRVPAVLTLQRH